MISSQEKMGEAFGSIRSIFILGKTARLVYRELILHRFFAHFFFSS
jgi:hypothetical protein